MKVYTYQNPFELTSAVFWDEIKDAPHLCVSQTLVEGLIDQYGRHNFRFLGTVDGFLNELYKPWRKSAKSQVEQFLLLSDLVKEIPHEKLQRAFYFNRREVMEALRFLFEVDLDPSAIDCSLLSEEQKQLLTFYVKLQEKYQWNMLPSLQPENERGVYEAFANALATELASRLNKEHLSFHQLRQYLLDHPEEKFQGISTRESLRVRQHYISLLDEYDPQTLNVRKVVIHGVHQFTPLIHRMIKGLQDLNIEIVFMINNLPQYPRIFQTWQKVYEWMNPTYISDPKPFLHQTRTLGKAIGDLIHGETEINFDRSLYSVHKYDNLSSLCDDIGRTFKKASEKISNMSEQFYSANNQEINELLKSYFPNHFKSKKFLAYPIGQFILSLYKMWDHNRKHLVFQEEHLRECLVIPLCNTMGQRAALDIYLRIRDYLQGVENEYDVINRVTCLRQNKIKIEEQGEIDLNRFSFFQVSIDELDTFLEVLKKLRVIAEEVFADSDGDNIHYGLHYKKLLQIIEENIGFDFATKEEKKYVQMLKERFEQIEQLEVRGSIDDLRETIYFYLQATDPEDNGSHWICRNFEQLDGGVLLRNKRSNEFHLTFLSNEKMNVRANELFPWPIDQDFFEAYEAPEETAAKIVLSGKREYKNFLRYMLFYATYYLSSKVHISYVENSEGEKDTFYFLLDMLGLSPTRRENNDRNIDFTREQGNEEIVGNFPALSIEALQDMSICDYRYFLNQILKTGPFYRNDFHHRYYYSNLILERVATRYSEGQTEIEFRAILDEEYRKLRPYFPFWLDTDFFDMHEMVAHNPYVKQQTEKTYLDVRKRYLVAKIEGEHDPNLMYDVLVLANQYWGKHEIVKGRVEKKFARIKNLSDLHTDEVNPLLCTYCNVKDLCLNFYKRGKYDE